MTQQQIHIDKAEKDDSDAIWNIFSQIIKNENNTYVYPPETTKEEAMFLWAGPATETYVAKIGANIVGAYYLRPNHHGHGSHVANAGFIVDPGYRNHGVGKTMAFHAMDKAKKEDYSAMQFNAVVSSNSRAVKLWESLGFKIIGTVPKGFYQKDAGLIDLLIMHKFL